MMSVIACVKENAARRPDAAAVAADGVRWSYADLWAYAEGFAAYLRDRRYEPGARIVVKAVPCIDFVIAALGCGLAGCVFVPIEKMMGEARVREIADKVRAALLIADCRAASCDHMELGTVRQAAMACADNRTAGSLPAETSQAVILYTTGTTGQSKGVVLSHRALFAGCDNNRFADRLTEDSVYLIAAPINHANGFRKLCSCLIGGACAVLLDGFLNVGAFYQAIREHGVNVLLLPPSAAHILLRVSASELAKYASQIKVVHSGSAAMPETDKQQLVRLLPHTRLLFGYGASEAGNACVYDYAAYPGLENCVGKPNPHTTIFIVNEQREPIKSSRDCCGCLAISGDTLMDGYDGDAELTAEVLRDGVLYTNDIGYIDENGFVYVLGRKDDVINSGGLKIAPVEVENVALRYPGVSECICYGVPDAANGAVPKLKVVCADGQTLDTVGFRAYLQQHLAYYKVPAAIEVVDALPKTANGKPDRKNLE